jgi:hypothetical protein
MSSLLDLGPLTEEVEIRGVKLTINGLSAADLFKLFSQFPDLQQKLAQLGSPGAVMMNLAPDLFAKMIAMAVGAPGDAEMEARAKKLGAADQINILAAVQRLSFPEGFGPFVEQMTKLAGMPPTPSSTISNSSENASLVPSSGELQTDSPGMTRGISPRVN